MPILKGSALLLTLLLMTGCTDPATAEVEKLPAAATQADNPLLHLEQQLRRAEDVMQQQEQQARQLQEQINQLHNGAAGE